MMRSNVALVVMALVVAMVTSACRTNPATGRRQLDVLSTEQEISLGVEAKPEFTADYGGEIPDAQITAFVRDMGMRLAEVSERPDLPWEFTVLDSAVINAFALPGGKVFITRALLEKMDNSAQLAGVLGHEVGHVTAQHINEQMGQQMVLQGLLTGIGVVAPNSQWATVLGVGAQAGGTVYLLSFGRDQEHEADELGLRYMAKIGYNPMGQVQVMRILEEASEGASRPPEWLSTHPEPGNRADRLAEIIPRRFPNFDRPGRFTFGEEAFRENVTERLKQLPPPRHRGN